MAMPRCTIHFTFYQQILLKNQNNTYLGIPRIEIFLTWILHCCIVQDSKICAVIFFPEHLKPLFYFSAPLLIQISIYFGSRRSLWKLKSQLWLVKHIVWLPQFVVCLRISFNHLCCAWLCIYIQHMETVMLLI